MGAGRGSATAQLRALPAVHALAAQLASGQRESPVSWSLAVRAARLAIDERRATILSGHAHPSELAERAGDLLRELQQPSLRRVLNASGVVIHTNLGRAPLPDAARLAVIHASQGYSNLELDLTSGTRGSRHVHVEGLLRELTGAEAGFAVNNGAAAVLLAVAALAGRGRAVVVSRGQLIEIGGGFRIPDVIAQSGATMIEVGTTNRTRLRDYERALADAEVAVGAILRVHQSNFRTVGFVEEVPVEDLCGLGVPVIDDVGSGRLARDESAENLAGLLAGEPPVERSLAAGATLVVCSADKLVGGPQAGLLLGRQEAVRTAAEHPLARAMRIDKLSLAALEATLRLLRDHDRAGQEVPVLAMLGAGEESLARRARLLCEAIGPAATVVRARGRVGGGALPLAELEGPVVALAPDLDAEALSAALRAGEPPMIARIDGERVLLDPRTLLGEELELAAAAVRQALPRATTRA